MRISHQKVSIESEKKERERERANVGVKLIKINKKGCYTPFFIFISYL